MNEGKKDDGDKLRYDLIPLDAEEQVVRALMFGAKKYGDDNWRLVPDAERRYYNAFRRHVRAWKKGEVLDPESGLPHLAHAVCSLLFLLEGFEPQRSAPLQTTHQTKVLNTLNKVPKVGIQIDPDFAICECGHKLAYHNLQAGCWVARSTGQGWNWCQCPLGGPFEATSSNPQGLNPDGTPFKPEAK